MGIIFITPLWAESLSFRPRPSVGFAIVILISVFRQVHRPRYVVLHLVRRRTVGDGILEIEDIANFVPVEEKETKASKMMRNMNISRQSFTIFGN